MFPRQASLWLATALLLASSCLQASKPGGSPDFDAMLRQAELVRSSDPVQFQRLLGELNASIDGASDRQREQLAYLKAYHLAYTGRFDLGIDAARKLFDTTSDVQLKFRVGSLIVNSYAATREFTEGLRFLDQTLAMVEQVQDPEVRHHGWSSAAAIYNQVGQYELGLHYANLVLADAATPRTACITGYYRLEALYYLSDLRQNEDSAQELTDMCELAGEPLAGLFLQSYRARFRTARGDRAGGIATLDKMLPDVEATKYARLISEVHSLLAEWKLADGLLEDAERHARIAIERSVGIEHSLPLVNAYETLYEISLQRGDTENALVNLRAYTDANRAYLDSIKTRELAFQMVKHETLQKTQTIELLAKQNEVLRLEQEVSLKSTQATRLLIALLAVLVASIGYWAFKVKRMQLSFRHLAETDALTGISNRHHFSRRAEDALVYCRKSGEEAGLVMMDLDNFKTINDRYGHAIGDWTLQQVAHVCAQACRQNDLVGRLGGEEFAFLLVGCGLDASAELAEQCRQAIAAIDTRECGHHFKITASFGVAGSKHSDYDLGALMVRADGALYRSKREGRNRVTLHGGSTAAFHLASPLA